MSAGKTFYGPADVAEALGVSRPAVSNWKRRGVDIPPPDYVAPDGATYWTDLGPWHEWHAARRAAAAEAAERNAHRRDYYRTKVAPRHAAERAERARARAAARLARARAALAEAEAEARRVGLDTDR